MSVASVGATQDKPFFEKRHGKLDHAFRGSCMHEVTVAFALSVQAGGFVCNGFLLPTMNASDEIKKKVLS